MKIAIFGYGKMGKEIEKVAIKRGHSIDLIIDVDDSEKLTPDNLQEVDVAIEFSTPDSAFQNIEACLKSGIPVVSGTTGWTDRMEEAVALCKQTNGTFFHASNYSIGVNILFAINKILASIMNDFQQYDVSLSEVHHIHKLDSPSGTAITLAEDIVKQMDRIKGWSEYKKEPGILPINAKRVGEVNGYHEITYDSTVDTITFSHNAKSRAGFAEGAVLAAEFSVGKKGILCMKDLLNL